MQLVSRHGDVDSINATPLGHGTRSRTYRPGRICGTAGCATLLSRYNPGARCSLHDH